MRGPCCKKAAAKFLDALVEYLPAIFDHKVRKWLVSRNINYFVFN